MRAMSAKRRRALKERAKVREAVIERDAGCRARYMIPGVTCSGGVAVHEIRRRAQDRSAWLNVDLCVTLCDAHHEHIHHHVEDAERMGFLVRGEAICAGCQHALRCHPWGSQCIDGTFGMECPCTAFVEAAA
jgi:hypothetical protein